MLREDLVDQSVREINRVYIAKGLEAARGIGEHVLKTYFAGNVDNFRTRGKEHVSFRKLVEREDLRVSYNQLWYSVAVVDQLKALPADLANALPISHHKLLVPVADEKAKTALARKAVRENLTVQELAAEVRRIRNRKSNGSKRGRPPLPEVVHILSELHRTAQRSRFLRSADTGVDHMSPERLQAVLHDAEQDLKDLRQLVDRLRSTTEADAVDSGRGTV